MLHAFISTDITQRVILKTTQRLASWGNQYGEICRVIALICGVLNRGTWERVDTYLSGSGCRHPVFEGDAMSSPIPVNLDY